MRQPKPWFRASKSAWYVEHQSNRSASARTPTVPRRRRRPPPAGTRRRPILDAFYKLMAGRPGEPAEAGQDHRGRRLRPVPRPLPEAPRPGHVRQLPLLPPVVLRRLRPAPGRRPQAVPRHPLARRPPDVEGRPAARRHRRQAGLLLGRPAGPPLPEPAPGAQGRAGSTGGPGYSPRTSWRRSSRRSGTASSSEFVRAMLETGCRPSEVARVTAADVEPGGRGVGASRSTRRRRRPTSPGSSTSPRGWSSSPARLAADAPDRAAVPRAAGDRRRSPATAIRCRFRRLRAKLPAPEALRLLQRPAHLRHQRPGERRGRVAARLLGVAGQVGERPDVPELGEEGNQGVECDRLEKRLAVGVPEVEAEGGEQALGAGRSRPAAGCAAG